MKNLSKLFLGLLLVASVSACKKDKDGGDGGSAAEGTIKAKIGGTSWTSIKMSTNATYVSAGKMLTIMGTDAGGKNIKIILLGYNETTGTWEISNSGIAHSASYIETNISNPSASKTWMAPYADSGVIGEVKIAEYSKTGSVKGTFKFKARNQNDSNDFKEITEGAFNVKVTSM